VSLSPPRLSRASAGWLMMIGAAALLSSCGSHVDTRNKMIISARDQRLLLISEDNPIKSYRVSTSKYGLGSRAGSKQTPLGRMAVARKIGGGARPGTVFKSRRPTGEILKPNAPGRDPIVSRIIWLRGRERENRNTFRRYIYIHGTPEERTIGRPASYGCIRMRSRDVIDLYRRIGVGAEVRIIRGGLNSTPEGRKYYTKRRGTPGAVNTASTG